jgi:hypothetical protein
MSQSEPAEADELEGPIILKHRAAPDPDGLSKSARINLGIDLLHALREPGERYTRADIAAWCDCRELTVKNIERAALAKLRKALREAGINRDALRSLVTDHSREAVRKPRAESV